MNIKDYETLMWEAAKNRDSEKFLQVVSADAVMFCGGFRCTGAEYAEIIKDFDVAAYEMSHFEVVAEAESICQVHYVIVTTVSDERNRDLEGTFQVTSTWKKQNGVWKLIFNMDSRIMQ